MADESLRVLYRDDELVAVDKPAGLLVHPSALDAHEQRTALGLLRDQLGERLWPLHRLDKATSGVLLFARDAQAARRWGQAFEGGEVRKRYLALVRGWPPEHGVVDYPLARDPELPSQGQPRLPATTQFQRLATFEWPFAVSGRHPTSRYALVEAQPLSGRRHQIRRHFKHIAHPLVGDSTHGKGPHNRAVAAWLGVERLWLHALSVELGALRIEAACGLEWRQLLPQAYPMHAAGSLTMSQNVPTSLSGLRVAILALDGFEQVEMTEPRKALQDAGARTTLVSMNKGQVQGFHHDKPADKFDVDLTLEQAKPQDFDAVLLPGGVMNADKIRNSRHAQEFVQGMQLAGKPFGVICHAPWLLVSAGLVKGRRMTSWPSLQDDLRNAGAQWEDQDVVRDANWVTSRKPADLPAFNKAVIELFATATKP